MKTALSIILILVTVFLSSTSFAQKGNISGIAFDSVAGKGIPDATVTLMLQKDSSLISFGTTDYHGRFTFKGLSHGIYRLLISHVAYHNFNKKLTISDSINDVALGNLSVIDKSKTLDEVVVQNEAPPVTLIGDTVEYNAGSFRTQPNATVEQLLKKLPGVNVEKDGTVKTQGQKVTKVLVDGKEFFGNDPKMATKNLPADAIDKVQVFDKASDQASLTGFDDGNSEKTINLKLKKDKKTGSFGKLMAGGGSSERVEARGNQNYFNGARQFSMIAAGNNTNTEAFSFNDMMDFTGELSKMLRGGGGTSGVGLTGNSDAASGTNQGIRSVYGGGINYNNIIGTKTEITSNYFYNNYSPSTITDGSTQYLLPDSSYYYNRHALDKVQNNTHKLNLGVDYQIDSFHSIKFNPSFGFQNAINRQRTDYIQSGMDAKISNQGFNESTSNSNANNFRADFLFRKKFRKRGRTFSISASGSKNEADFKGYLESINESFQRTTTNQFPDTINQRNFGNSNFNAYNFRAVYTEPIFKKSMMEFSAGTNHSKSESSRASYDFDEISKTYNNLNELLSNDFFNSYNFNTAGWRIRTKKPKYQYTVGVALQNAELRGKITSAGKDSILSKKFSNILPNARVQYNFSRYKNLTMNYRSNTNPPDISQLQPIADITDRLNIKLGNPSLKQEFTQFVDLNYSGISMLKRKDLFLYTSASRTDNKIVNSDSIGESGVKYTRPVNTDGIYTVNGSAMYSLPVRSLNGSIRLGAEFSFYSGKQFLNASANKIRATGFYPNIGIDISPVNSVDISFNGRFNYNRTSYSLKKDLAAKYVFQVYDVSADWQFLKKTRIGSDITYTVNSRLTEGFNAKVPLWGGYLSHQFLKLNRGEIKFRVNDILNRNIGVSRNSNQNSIEDIRTNTIKRYAMLTFTYSLSKMGQAGNGPDATRIFKR